MFDFSFGEIFIAGAVALVVLGPERLPKAARTLGEWFGKIQRMTHQVKNEWAQQADYAQLNQIKNDLHQELNSVLPAWERLPEPHTPADFGLDDDGIPLTPVRGLHTQSLRKQAMGRKRDLRPRFRAKPRFRSRR